MISNYARPWITFCKGNKVPGVSKSFYTFSYSHIDPVNNAIRKYENHSSV